MTTARCLICLKEACTFSGHVLKGRKLVTAGWCLAHSEDPVTLGFAKRQGCYGGWLPEYGIRKCRPPQARWRPRIVKGSGVNEVRKRDHEQLRLVAKAGRP